MSVTSVCCGCLNSGRKMSGIEEFWKKHYFSQIINEVMMPHQLIETLKLCYECDALLTKFVKFKHQVKHSYSVLCDYSQENISILDPKPSPLTINYNVYKITLHPDSDIDEEIIEVIKQEDLTPKLKLEVKEEDSTSVYSDNQELLDNQDEPTPDLKQEHAPLKKKKKARLKNKRANEMYREVELSLEEIIEERREMALAEEFVDAMFRCERCLIAFPNADDLSDHFNLKHELHAAHKCDICERTFTSEVSYNYHTNKHTRRYECCACSSRFASKRGVLKHYDQAHCCGSEMPYKMSTKDKNGEADDSIKQEKFPCEFCHKTFRWKTSLRKHLETHKIETGQKRKPYCEPCRLSFTTTSNLQKHVKTSSKHQIQLKLRKLQGTQPIDPTSDTQAVEQIKTAISRSMQQYPCPQCDKKFQWRGNLARHLHSHAARANGELVCEPCNRTFSSIATYKQHMKISKKHVSENDFKYMCSDCGKRFANKTKLKDHIDWEHLKNYTHTCDVCQKVFKSHTSLYLHRQVVHKKDGADHLCDHCGKAFPNHAKLRSHITALHSGASPYRCNVCPARFSWHSCLSRHVRRTHPRRKKEEPAKIDLMNV